MSVVAVLAVLDVSGAPAGEEQPVPSRVVAAGSSERSRGHPARGETPRPGTFLIEDAPDPVHGTWWVESDANVEARTAVRE